MNISILSKTITTVFGLPLLYYVVQAIVTKDVGLVILFISAVCVPVIISILNIIFAIRLKKLTKATFYLSTIGVIASIFYSYAYGFYHSSNFNLYYTYILIIVLILLVTQRKKFL
jgi:hypothetical protein